MAVLNITTNKNRAQMVTELTNWADATKVSGSNYVWACADNINVTADIELYGFTLIFASEKKIIANAGGHIKVSLPHLSSYIFPSTLYLSGPNLSDIDLVAGTGRWTGARLNIVLTSASVRFNSATSSTNLTDFSIDAIDPETTQRTNLKINMLAGSINLYRVTGTAIIRDAGNISMNPKGIGLVSGERRGPAKLLSGTATFPGFIILNNAANITQTSSPSFGATTITFKDGYVNPLFIGIYPKGDAASIRKVERTLTLHPKTVAGVNLSAFNYRVSSNRIVQPAGTSTPNTQIVTENNKAYGYQYVMNVWNGNNGSGSGSYGVALNQVIDKDFRVQFRKYGHKEEIFSSNSYYFAVDATVAMQNDTFIRSATPILASITTAAQFYDGVRSLIANNFAIPDDVLTTDGETLTIKSGWELAYNTISTELLVLTSTSRILLGKDSFIGKMNTGKFKYSNLSGSVSREIAPHTDLIFAREDGRANLDIQITCPTGASNPIVGVWPHSQGLSNRSGMLTSTATGVGIQTLRIAVNPATKYYCVAKALGTNQFAPFVIDPVGSLGTKVFASLFVYEKANGSPILPLTLTAEQTLIANMFIFDAGHVDIKIPTTYAANPRWSTTDKIWQFTSQDFIPIAWKLDFLQTTIAFLQLNQILYIQDGSILVSASANTGILEQDPANGTTVGTPTVPPKISITTISIGRIGDTNGRNTFIDNKNGTIDVRGGVPVAVSLSGGFTNDDQTKLNETHQRLALDATKPLTSKPDGGITSTGIAITATELADGSVVQTRGT